MEKKKENQLVYAEDDLLVLEFRIYLFKKKVALHNLHFIFSVLYHKVQFLCAV